MKAAPDFVVLGHITRDIQPDGSFSLGGTATFAALTAQRLGTDSGIVTRADAQLLRSLSELLPDITIHARSSDATTTFANTYTSQGFRIQHLHAHAEALRPDDVPNDWLAAPIILFGPLAQEIDASFTSLFPHRQGRIVAATPQGWLRRWDSDGRVWPTPWQAAPQILPNLDALILSRDDLLPFADGDRQEADNILAQWSKYVPLLVATDGRHGASLFRSGSVTHFPAYPVSEIDPTGAGDVFAAAFLVHLSQHQQPEEAVNFANCVASFSIEQPGTKGIPTLKIVKTRLKKL
ncbi:MAG TPA: PfkB family carbohydrate kinase [Ktedonobacteraceae bacterium]